MRASYRLMAAAAAFALLPWTAGAQRTAAGQWSATAAACLPSAGGGVSAGMYRRSGYISAELYAIFQEESTARAGISAGWHHRAISTRRRSVVLYAGVSAAAGYGRAQGQDEPHVWRPYLGIRPCLDAEFFIMEKTAVALGAGAEAASGPLKNPVPYLSLGIRQCF